MNDSNEEESEVDEGSIAHKTIKLHFPKVCSAVTKSEIPDKLYSKELIGEEMIDIVFNQTLTEKSKGRRLVRELQEVVKLDHKKFHTLCEILSEDSVTSDLSRSLTATYKELWTKEQESISNAKENEDSSNMNLCDDFQQLKEDLEFYNRQLSKEMATPDLFYKCIQESITLSIKNAFRKGDELQTLQDQMWWLCNTAFKVPTQLRVWALEQVKDEYAALAPREAISQVESTTTIKTDSSPPSLFSKETIHHASLCCHAVSTCTAGNYKDFFAKRAGHQLHEVSMSRSQDRENVDRYIIAKQRDTNIIYVAFESEPTLTRWMDSPYSSFEEGLKKQMSRIPLRYFVEQLGEQKRIVFTGFSFGGMLACYVTANLWEGTYVSVNNLQKNVVCITFGQPLINIPLVQEAIEHVPQIKEVIHSIFYREDAFPLVLRYHNDGRTHYRGQPSKKPQNAKALPGTFTPSTHEPETEFRGKFAHIFLRSLAKLYQASFSGMITTPTNVDEALTKLKDVLREIIPLVQLDKSVFFGKYYVISTEEDIGLQWNNLSKEIAAQVLGTVFSVEKLDALKETSFKKHNMEEYCNKVFRSYLEKEPKYQIPPSSLSLQEMPSLKPDVKGLEFHKYPSEHVVVLEGENLWFCNEIRLGEGNNILKIQDPADSVSRRSITFNYPPTDKTEGVISSKDGRVNVTLYSHFANPIRRKIVVLQEPYSFSLRQIQLAKHTPREVIQLAFWSALLEQYDSNHASDKGPSQRLNELTHFLEEAVKVVPIESIFFAIGYSDDDTAFECTKALLSSKTPKIPFSSLMVEGMQTAAVRLRTGLHGSEITERVNSVIATSYTPGLLYSVTAPNSKTIHVKLLAPITQTTQIPLGPLMPRPTYSEVTTHRRHASTMDDLSLIFHVNFIAEKEETIHLPEKEVVTYASFADKLEDYRKNFQPPANHAIPDIVCNLSIEHVYPINSHRRHTIHATSLQSPLEVLCDARKKIAGFIEESKTDCEESNSEGTLPGNEKMLELVKEINDCNLQICAALLGSFMEQQICIPMLKQSEADTASLLSEKSSPVAVGVWALFSMGKEELQAKLANIRGNSLMVEIQDYISGVFSDRLKKPSGRNSKYAAKLQFLLQGIKKTVSCSSQYISYSLEHQLCNNLKFDKSIPVSKLIKEWDTIFAGDALSLVAKTHRSLIARWLKWAVLVHDLREALAKYTCIGVTGLVNSGKSQLISKLFGVQTDVGTTEKKRTTVPLLYNLDDRVKGLDVIDFPGVDDKDHSLPELAELLLGLVQVVVFVVDYRRIFTDVAKEWLKLLETEDVPVVVCLTHADNLYTECIEEEKGNPNPTDHKQRKIGADLTRKREKIGLHPSRTSVDYYCFSLPAGYKEEVNQENLRQVGIRCPYDVGMELVKMFATKLDQKDLADRLESYMEMNANKCAVVAMQTNNTSA